MYSKDLVQKVRKAYAKHKSYRKVAKAFWMTHSSVKYILLKMIILVRKKNWPKKRFNNRLKGRILLKVKRLAARSERITARKIRTNCNIDFSVRHLKRGLNALKLAYKHIPKKISLGLKQKEPRVKFAEEHLEHPGKIENTV
jgi:hypothetical protein